MNKEITKIVRRLRGHGWAVTRTKRGSHFRAEPVGGGPVVFFSSTPSDTRALHRIRADFRRRGVEL